MSTIASRLRAGLVFCFMTALGVELAAFCIVSLTNVILYGHIREGSRAIYDPYALFLQTSPERLTLGNAPQGSNGDTKTVWMFGGSTMRGSTDDDGRTIPSFAAAILNQKGGSHRYVIRNFGINSFNSLMESKYLQKLLIEERNRPDLILFYDGANDSKYFVEFRTPDAHHGYSKVKGVIESYYGAWLGFLKPVHAALYASFTYELWGRLNQVALPLSSKDPELAQMVERTMRRYEAVERMAAGFGSRFLLAWQPMRWTQDCAAVPDARSSDGKQALPVAALEQMANNFRAVYGPLRDGLANRSYFYDLSAALCAQGFESYQIDGVHLTDEGRRAVAARLAARIATLFGEK